MNTPKTKPKCTHSTSIDIGKLQRILESSTINDEKCINCTGFQTNGERVQLWMCLKCGDNLCGRFVHQHALNHYKVCSHT